MREVRLIDANALKEEVNKKNVVGRFNTLLLIDNAPTVDAPTADAVQYTLGYQDGFLEGKKICERPQGKWIKWNFQTFGAMGDWEYKCSNCEKVYGGEYNFCPNCGAYMKGGKDNESKS